MSCRHVETRLAPGHRATDTRRERVPDHLALPDGDAHPLSSPVYQSRPTTSSISSSNPPEYLSGSQLHLAARQQLPSSHYIPPRSLSPSIPHPTYHSSNSRPPIDQGTSSLEIETLSSSPPEGPYYTRTHGQNNSSFIAQMGHPSDHEIDELKLDPQPPPDLQFDHHSDTDKEGQSFDDYDWDNDDDLEGDVRFADLNDDSDSGQHHRRRTLARRFSPYNVIKFLLNTFIGNILLSLMCIIPPVVIRFAGYYESGNTAEAIQRRYVYDNTAAWLFWASYNLMATWALHLIIEFVPRLSVLLVGVIWGDVNETIKTQVEVFNTAKPWVKAIFTSGMLWGSWEVIFNNLYGLHKRVAGGAYRAPYTETVSIAAELLFCFMVVLSFEKLLLLSISMSFHRVAYADRIQKVTRALAVIDILQDYRPKRKSYPMPANSRRGSGDVLTMKGLAENMMSPLKKTHSHTASPARPAQAKRKWWQRRRGEESGQADEEKATDAETSAALMAKDQAALDAATGVSVSCGKDFQGHLFRPTEGDIGQKVNLSPKLRRRNSTTTFAALAQRGASAAKIARAAMKDPISVVGKKSGLGLDINNPSEARKLARKIYFGMKADANRTYLIPSDFYPAFPTHQMAKDAFLIFDTDGNGDISRTEVKNEIFRVYKERRALAQSLQDVGHAIGKLDKILLALSAIVFLFIALSVVGIDFSKALTSIYTVGIAAAFIFKETAGNVFDAIIMVFCTHPYDTGDRIIMDNAGVEEVLVVKQMGLLATVFARWDGTEWFAPNALLGQKFIINLRRSSSQFENATVQFGWDTPLEKLDLLEEKMNLWLQTDEQRRFEPGTACVIQKLVNQQYMEITLGMTHRENWQDWGGRWNRRTAFHAALNHYTRELGISFYNSEQPVEMKNWHEVRDGLMNEQQMDDDDLNNEDGDDEYEAEENGAFMGQNEKPMDEQKQQMTPPAERMPETLGFSAPPEDGTGMRKRKKLSKKKAMLGDA